MIRYEILSGAAKARHLIPLGAFHPQDMGSVQTLVLLGPDEPGFWPEFTKSPEFNDGGPDAMDRWSERVIGEMANSLGGTAFFPFGGPPFQPFFDWALASGRCWPSPLGLLVHDTAGLFVSFRGALGFSEHIDLPEVTAPSPCTSCVALPCQSACPVSAFGPLGYDVVGCKSHLRKTEGENCMGAGCLARRACPISQSYGRLAEQSAYHMKAFL